MVTQSLAIASAIAFEGCATSSSVRVTEINSYSHTQSASIRSNGAANMQISKKTYLVEEIKFRIFGIDCHDYSALSFKTSLKHSF